MSHLLSALRITLMLGACTASFAFGAWIAMDHVERDPWPDWVDAVCIEGKATWGNPPIRRECHVIGLPTEDYHE